MTSNTSGGAKKQIGL